MTGFKINPATAGGCFCTATARIEFLTRCVCQISIAAVLIACSLGGSFATAQESVEIQDAFSKRNYPWYDKENDGAKRIDFRERQKAVTQGRNLVPLKPPTPATRNRAAGTTGRGALQGLSYLSWILIGVAVLTVFGVLIWAFLRMESRNRDRSESPESKRSIEESIKQLPFDIEASGGDFRSLAQRAYGSGDYRKAIIFLFSHVLVSLDQKNLIRLRKGKTNRQYLREIRPYRNLANYYQRVMVPFEATFFGEHELNQEDFENCWNQLDGFQTGIDQTVQVADA